LGGALTDAARGGHHVGVRKQPGHVPDRVLVGTPEVDVDEAVVAASDEIPQCAGPPPWLAATWHGLVVGANPLAGADYAVLCRHDQYVEPSGPVASRAEPFF
jgi:hypothetical protein